MGQFDNSEVFLFLDESTVSKISGHHTTGSAMCAKGCQEWTFQPNGPSCNTLLAFLTNSRHLWMLLNLQHPSTPSPVPHRQTLMNPRLNSNMGFIKCHPWHLPNPNLFPNIVIISCILISSDYNPVLPFLYTLPHFVPFASPLP